MPRIQLIPINSPDSLPRVVVVSRVPVVDEQLADLSEGSQARSRLRTRGVLHAINPGDDDVVAQVFVEVLNDEDE